MLDADTIKSLAAKLEEAERTRTQLRHFSARFPEMTIEDGYAIQREWVRLKLAAGHKIRGRKIGLTSKAMQRSSQISEPDYAPLLDSMFFEGGGDIPAGRAALANLEAIAAVDGVDGIFFGPFRPQRLHGYLGQPNASAVQDAILAGIVEVKASGVLATDRTVARRYLAAGAQFFAAGTDIGLLGKAAVELAREYRGGADPLSASQSGY